MIKNMRNLRPGIYLLGLFLFMAIFFGCSKKEKTDDEQMMEMTPSEAAMASIELKEEEAEPLMMAIMDIQEKIKTDPENVELRKELLEKCWNAEKGAVYTAGVGLHPLNATNEAIAQKSAERSAYLDACRWVAYLRLWVLDPTEPNYGEIKGQLPGTKIVFQKQKDENTVNVLVASAH